MSVRPEITDWENTGKISSSVSFHRYFQVFYICFRTLVLLEVTSFDISISCTTGGGGRYLTKFCTGRLPPRSNPLPFHIPFWQKRYPFYILFIEKRYPFHIPILGLLVLVFMWCLINELLQPSGASIRKIIIKGPFKYLNEGFPHPFIYLNLWNPYPFYTWSLKKVPLSGGASPYRPL